MPSELRSILAEMRAARRETFAALQTTPESRMGAKNTWAGVRDSVRFLFLRIADHEEEHALHLAATLQDFGFRQTRAQRTLGAAEATRGDLYATLVGLSDADLDLTPEGEWPLRRTLAHIIQSERSYTRQTRHAVDLFRAGQPWERPDPVEDEPQDGTLGSFLARLDATREATLETLSDIPDEALVAPTVWAERNVTVNFRLMRYAHHEREHTAHVLKWRYQVDRAPTEAERLLGLAWRARGVLESVLVGVPDDLLDRDPATADGTVREVLHHIIGSERYLHRQIEGATFDD